MLLVEKIVIRSVTVNYHSFREIFAKLLTTLFGYFNNLNVVIGFKKALSEIIRKATEIINNAVAVPCTSCGYCVEAGCPVNVNVPKYFELYNAAKTCRMSVGDIRHRYKKLGESFGTPSDCISCGKCEKACPQHLKVREYLAAVAEHFDG